MKRFLLILLSSLLVLSIGLAACAAMPARDGLIELRGEVSYVSLEGGFYSLGGYRLVSDTDLKPFLHKTVSVIGYEDDSPSIFMVKSLLVSEIAEQSDTPSADGVMPSLGKVSVQGVLNYNYSQKAYTVRQYTVQWDDFAPYFGQYVRVDGTVDKSGVLNVSSIAVKDSERIRKQIADELFFATYHNTGNRLKYALQAMVAVNGSVKKDSLYQKLARLTGKEDGPYSLFVNGRKIFFDPDALPFVKRTQPYASLQSVCEAFGLFQAQTFAATDKIMLSKGDLNMVFELNSRTVFVNDKKRTLSAAVTAVNGQAMLPVRFICEVLGYKTLWLSSGKVFAAFK